ncbi:carboxypeptidase-like regulatory domain-containing protein [Streptomyces sp. CME 23]|nr:carboxypeptidase-like regulatory domain-containing protein [Streptomyces sp. CME 23]MCH5675891.1 carboxypeptidase-like regulatory domain-containing protein [Streptomyces sp. CME 23]
MTSSGSVTGLAGRVEGDDGRPVGGATLTLVDQRGRQTARARTREDGAYGLPQPPPGSYVLVVSAEGHQPRAVDLTVGDRPVSRTVTLTGATGLHGTVRDADKAPVGEATVVVLDAHGEVLSTTTTAANGTYTIPGLPPGACTLQVSAYGHRPAAVPVDVDGRGATRQDVTLHPAGTVAGTVRHARTGRPVADARITLLDADGVLVASARTADDGTYTLTDLTPGAYTLVAGGHPPASATVTLDSADTPSVDLDLGR